MKRQITFLSLLILFTSSVISCKKDTTSLKARMMGKWTLNRVVTTGYADTKLNTDVKYGTTSDYIDYKSNNDDQVEISLSGNRTIGTYIIIYEDQFTMDLNDGANYCTVSSLTQNQFQFTAKIDKTNVVKVYYLTR